MHVAFAYDRSLDAYDLGPTHPMRPERVSRAVDLIEAYGLVRDDALVPLPFAHATRDDLLLVHDPAYIATVMRASGPEGARIAERGIGPGDTPAFEGMHEASAAIVGATMAAVEGVAAGEQVRAFSPAGGLHHAHHDRASGFCVYNDAAVGIASAIRLHAHLRVLYLDIDAHHGDGVQEAFWEEPRVLTLSIHESGRYLFPGTGFPQDRGEGAGDGYAINVPLPPSASDECYALVFERVVGPAARAFGPDLIVAQCGADTHWSDPLTTLGLTLPGMRSLYRAIVALADELCEGKLIALGGGGYAWQHVVPRAWTMLAAELAGVHLPSELPPGWLEETSGLTTRLPRTLEDDWMPPLPDVVARDVLNQTRLVIEKLQSLGVPG